MRRRGLETTSWRWSLILSVPIDYREWIGRYRSVNDYPFRDYGPAWEAAIRELQFETDARFSPFEVDDLPVAR